MGLDVFTGGMFLGVFFVGAGLAVGFLIWGNK